MFEKATKLKLRFATVRGALNVEDLWDLNLKDLNVLAKVFNALLKKSKEEDFLEEKNEEDAITLLKFEVVRHIMEYKKAENKVKKEESSKKAEREKILAALESKQDSELHLLSKEELLKKLDDLDTKGLVTALENPLS